eukprot:TRINITY_DN22430_c0_g2_i1.p1 TRINITY_DN22430_c0_g2~~TRINITY_DN22430_c0_g2_i1.p1  ORF type:complete len:654 (+),score=112.27 TRINITY_DN22430_c0_g2_i1:148-2109(+)
MPQAKQLVLKVLQRFLSRDVDELDVMYTTSELDALDSSQATCRFQSSVVLLCLGATSFEGPACSSEWAAEEAAAEVCLNAFAAAGTLSTKKPQRIPLKRPRHDIRTASMPEQRELASEAPTKKRKVGLQGVPTPATNAITSLQHGRPNPRTLLRPKPKMNRILGRTKMTSQKTLNAARKIPTSSEATIDEPEGRKMLDKRELRRRNRERYHKQLEAWRRANKGPLKAGPAHIDSQRVRVCVRKRPLFPHEEAEFDVVTVRAPEIVVHNCLTKADLKTLFIDNLGFHFASAFDETVDDSEVYAQCGQPAVQYALQGGSAVILMFGQTGSGKTHTMQALLQRASEELFQDGCLTHVCVGAFEIAGKAIRDLQDPENPDKELKVMVNIVCDTADGDQSSGMATRVHGLKWSAAASAEELLQLCRDAQGRRATRQTQANKVSSRSHSVIRIGRQEDDICLTLVDCAGSERNEDSTHHTAQDRKDAADINGTIFTLKECFRVMRSGNGQRPPFRDSLLTRVLADSLTSKDAKVIAIGTISPASKDTEHSLETLKSLQLLQGTQMTYTTREDVRDAVAAAQHPRTWSEETVRQWLQTAGNGRAEAWAGTLTRGTDGKMLVRWPVSRFIQLCGSNQELGNAVYAELHDEMKRCDDARHRR